MRKLGIEPGSLRVTWSKQWRVTDLKANVLHTQSVTVAFVILLL